MDKMVLPGAITLEDGYSYAPNGKYVDDWARQLKAAGYIVWMVSYEGRGVSSITVCYPGYRNGYHVRSENQVAFLLAHDAPVWG